jgi:hypothetical protein
MPQEAAERLFFLLIKNKICIFEPVQSVLASIRFLTFSAKTDKTFSL